MAKKKNTSVDVFRPFFEYLWSFYRTNRGQIRTNYKDLTKRILDYNDPEKGQAFLRKPQFEALEMYVFLKEYLGNPQLADLIDDWRHNRGKFQLSNTANPGHAQDLFQSLDASHFEAAYKALAAVRQAYANYIFALTMGVGKTILMGLCIFYEFLLAKKFPKDPRFCHNALVFAPDTTVLQSLREIMDFDMTKVLPPEYARNLASEIQFHFLETSGMTLNTLNQSSFNLIISNTQKIIRKKQNQVKTPAVQLFTSTSVGQGNGDYDDLYELSDEDQLSTNQRYQKIARLHQLGIYVDEAHHAFGRSLKRDMSDHESKTSLRLTIDSLASELQAAGSRVVACYNFTGTPYVENELMPEVVYAFALKDAIQRGYLKTATVTQVRNAKSLEFIRNAVKSFLAVHQDRTYEGMLPKMALFAATVEELQGELRPQVEQVLIEEGLSTSSILVNVGDEKITSSDDIREFRSLDTKESTKQFILLVGKGKEGWNCRSLFSVVLFREPKSKIFVLQATMRCLRSITNVQQQGHIFLSEENYAILAAELEANFRLSIDDFQSKPESDKIRVIVKPKKPLVFVEVVERKTLFQVNPKNVEHGTPLGLEDLNPSDYRVEALTADLRNLKLTKGGPEDLSHLRSDQHYTALTLVGEIARYLNMSPIKVREVLDATKEGVQGILDWVNRSNRILYEMVIPKLFHRLFTVKIFRGDEEVVRKLLVKDPPDGDEGYEIHVKPELFVREASPDYLPYSQKSFHLDGYGFDSSPEREFFDRHLGLPQVKSIWFTGMLTHGQAEFFVHYLDPTSRALRSYYPDFLIELDDGKFLIVEIKGENKIDDPVNLAKKEYAQQMSADNGMRYIVIPSKQVGLDLFDRVSQGALL